MCCVVLCCVNRTAPRCIKCNDVTIFLFVELGPAQADGKSCNGAFGMAVICMRFRSELVRTEVLIL